MQFIHFEARIVGYTDKVTRPNGETIEAWRMPLNTEAALNGIPLGLRVLSPAARQEVAPQDQRITGDHAVHESHGKGPSPCFFAKCVPGRPDLPCRVLARR